MAEPDLVFSTPRLVVRPATETDAAFIVTLWADPRVMHWVGFPQGLPTAAEDVPRRLRSGQGLSALLIAEERASSQPVGQCTLGAPDADGVCEPDIKLSPPFWGQGYGSELWSAIVDQAFLRSTCRSVRGTPNVENVASIRMQEGAGMRRVGQGVFEFPTAMRSYTESVPHYVYEIKRDEWADRRERDEWVDRRERVSWSRRVEPRSMT